nr:FG-GAP-like repeat-containing protein [Synechocystis sp. FACHB-383]
MADIDGDGDLDAIVGEFDRNLKYFQNTGSNTAPVYTEQTGTANPFNGINIRIYSKPTLADLDGDGDLDAIVGGRNGTLKYFQNTGSSTAPVYTEQTGTANPFDGINVGSFSAPTFADLDGDGDLDAIVGESYGTLRYYQNTGSSTAPVYTEQTGTANPFDGIDIGSYSAPTLADIDGDGDLDAIIGELNGTLKYFQNTGSSTAPVYTAQTGTANPFNGINIGSLSAPTFADIDGDGDLDAIVGENDGTLKYFQSVPAIAITPTGGNTQVTEGGATDSYTVVLNVQPSADVTIALNGGTQLSTNVTTLTFTSANWNVPQTVTVTAVDDGIGEGPHRGVITATSSSTDSRFNGIAIDAVPVSITDNDLPTTPRFYTQQTGTANPFNGIDVGTLSRPTLADLDGDGDLDAIVGEFQFNLKYYQNTGSSTAPVYTEQTGTANPFDGIDIGDYTAPTLADLDGDGDLDAIVGERYGNLKYYQNTGSSTAPVYTEQTGTANPFDGINIGRYSTPTFADLDGDGDLDAIVGENIGTLNYFQNTGSSTAPVYTAQTGAANPFDGIDIGRYSTPTFADIDGDGDLDAIIGEYDGTLKYYQNTGSSTAPVYTEQTGIANPFDGIDIGVLSAPTFADLDGDGDLDAIVGERDGNLNYFLSNATPTITSGTTANFAENGTGTVYTVTATDPESDSITYGLETTGDYLLFDIDSNTGVVTFKTSPDFEAPTDNGADNIYDITVTASDGSLENSQAVAISVTNVNEVPTITSGTTANFAENGTGIAYTVTATDPDAGTTLIYSISGTDSALFDINGGTGAVSFKTAPNFEAPTDNGADNIYDITVTASDGSLENSQAVAISVTNVNEVPTITSGTTANFAENGTGIAYTVTATDPDAGTTLIYSISGTDSALFDINGGTGAVSFKTAPNFEAPTDNGADNIYDITVTASDGSLENSQAVAISVTNVNQAPTITSGTTANFAENGTGTAYTVTATDPESDSITYGLETTGDYLLFDIDSNTGIVTFKTSPDFENPTDIGTDNVYDITVTASDGLLSDSQAIAITVTDVNEAPTITSGTTANFAENGTGTAYTVTATDPESDSITYSLTGSVDDALFDIDSSTGAVSFKTAPNFENPTDIGTDNVYDITVTASDGLLSDSQAIVITVTDVNEASSIDGNDAANFLFGTGKNDLIRGFGGNDILLGNGGNDTLYGGEGNDILNGGFGDDVLIGGLGRDKLIGGLGNDKFVYKALNEAGDVILDFNRNQDQLVLTELFTSLDYAGTDPIADGYLRFNRLGFSTQVQIDADGLSNGSNYITLTTLIGVFPSSLSVGTNVVI